MVLGTLPFDNRYQHRVMSNVTSSPAKSQDSCVFYRRLLGNREIYIPAGEEVMTPKSFSDIAVRFLEANGYEAEVCESEDEARTNVEKIKNVFGRLFFASDTTGEKSLEEFYTQEERRTSQNSSQ